MITVDDTIKKSKKSARANNAVNEEKLRTGQIAAAKQNYWPWIILAGLGIAGLVWWYKRRNNNGEVSG
jgi:LPXTG-motif cell wall-anchored protein